jgi:hypothetical protein
MSKLPLEQEALRRRTFAIIAHPDAGKTTLTEHILLSGGAIRAAGAVRARAAWAGLACAACGQAAAHACGLHFNFQACLGRART